MMVKAGIDHTTSSSRPEYSQSGQWNALVLEARKYQAKAKIATIVGTTIASMIAIESIRIILSAAATGPCGSRMFIGGVSDFPLVASSLARPCDDHNERNI